MGQVEGDPQVSTSTGGEEIRHRSSPGGLLLNYYWISFRCPTAPRVLLLNTTKVAEGLS